MSTPPRIVRNIRRASIILLAITLGLMLVLVVELIDPSILWLPGQPRTQAPDVQWGFRTFIQGEQ